ncbi:MAG: helix-turn-helix transcriptional regulator [Acidaminococcaceae bacterium]|jgi:DNA-binding CsgD family transcriptional regulator|nr:helix-turn-helix transcriptional regulator [Acidaminococcaceae bacterium]
MLKMILGLGLNVGWLWSVALDGPLLEQTAPYWQLTPETLFLLFFLGHTLSAFACGYLLKHTSLKLYFLLKIGPALTAFCTGLFLTLPVYCACPQIIPSYMGLLAAILAGIGAPPLLLSWCAAIGSLNLVTAAQTFAGSVVLATLITFGAGVLPLILQQLIFTSLPLLSLYLFLTSPHPAQNQPGNIDLTFSLLFPRQLLLILALIYVAGGSMFQLLFLNTELTQYFYLSNIAYALICLAGAVVLTRVQIPDLYLLYKPVLPLTGLGFLLLPLIPPLFSFLLLQGGLAAFDMYTWLLIASLSRAHLRPYTVTGYGLGWITLCIFGGNILQKLLSSAAGNLPPTAYVAAVAGAICLLATQLYPRFPSHKDPVPVLLPPPSEAIPPLPPEATPSVPDVVPAPAPVPAVTKIAAPEPEPLPVNLATIPLPVVPKTEPAAASLRATAAIYHVETLRILLTPRERQVLYLLTQGRNYKAIADKLGISQNTVKFHISHIYDKFGVYSRQELLQLLEHATIEN